MQQKSPDKRLIRGPFYLGPGAGLSTIGAFLAVVAGIIVALFGFVWYPDQADSPEKEAAG